MTARFVKENRSGDLRYGIKQLHTAKKEDTEGKKLSADALEHKGSFWI